MREMLYSETAIAEGIINFPDHPKLAIAAGKELCERVLEPLYEKFGRIVLRSAYRSPAVNQRGNEKRFNCARNQVNYGRHIWDVLDADGYMGAMACIVIPSFLPHYEATGDWTQLARWIHKNIPE
jgi:hypothetical protein